MPVDVSPIASAPVRLGLTGRDAVLQRVALFLATPRGTLPLDRRFGLTASLVDLPGPRAAARLRAEVVEGLARYVPEVRVLAVSVAVQAERVVPTVTLEFVEEAAV